MAEAGIDTSIFAPHSARAAATSAAKAAGMSTMEIMKMADWSRESTFETYYQRPEPGTNTVINYGAQGWSLNIQCHICSLSMK